MKRTLGFLLISLGLAAQTGIVSPPPFPNQTGQTNFVINPSAAADTVGAQPANWTGGTTSTTLTCHGNAHSIQLSSASSVTVSLNSSPGGHEAEKVTVYLTTDASFNGTGINLGLFDNNHGGGSLFSEPGRTYIPIAANMGCMQIAQTFWIPPEHRGDASWALHISMTGLTAGNAYLDEVTVEPDWYALRTFIKYPNFGYLWNDKTPPTFLNNGSATVANEILGVSEIDAPAGATVNSLTYAVATSAGCASPLYTNTINTPSTTQHWSITPAQMGGLPAVGTSLYVCSSISTTSGTVSYPDEKLIVEDATFRSGLMNYFDEYGRWIHNGAQKLALGAYSHNSALTVNTGLFSTGAMHSCPKATPALAYVYCFKGLSQKWYSPNVVNCGVSCTFDANTPTTLTDFSALQLDPLVWNFGTSVVANPDIPNGVNGVNDNLTPMLDGLKLMNHTLLLQQNSTYGYLVSGNGTATAPTWSPSVTTGSGSITATTLDLKVAAVTFPMPSGQGSTQSLETAPSSLTAVSSLSSNSVTFSVPSCPNNRYAGFFVYASTDGVTYHRQPNKASGAYAESFPVPCGASETLSSIVTTNITPQGSDQTKSAFYPPAWSWGDNTTTESQVIAAIASRMKGHQAEAGIYNGDEAPPDSVPNVYSLWQQTKAAAPDALTFQVSFYAAGAQLFREVTDVPSADYYAYGNSRAGAEYVTGSSSSARNCWNYTGTGNAQGQVTNCALDRPDLAGYLMGKATYGARPNWNVLQAWEFGTTKEPGYGEMRRQVWHSYIGCAEWGSLGCGTMLWSWNSSNGLEDSVLTLGNTNAIEDIHLVTSEMRQFESILLQPTQDSGQLGVGNVVSAVTMTASGTGAGGSAVTTATACRQGATASYWENLTYGPVGFVTKKDSATGDLYIFAFNRCNASAYDVNFTIVNPPSTTATVLVKDSNGWRTKALVGGVLTDTWNNTQATTTAAGNDEDAYVYIIRNPSRGNTQAGRIVVSGYIH